MSGKIHKHTTFLQMKKKPTNGKSPPTTLQQLRLRTLFKNVRLSRGRQKLRKNNLVQKKRWENMWRLLRLSIRLKFAKTGSRQASVSLSSSVHSLMGITSSRLRQTFTRTTKPRNARGSVRMDSVLTA